MKKLLAVLMFLTVSGCAISPPFNNRMDYMEIRDMRGLDSPVKDISIEWIPTEFPNQIEIKGASGFRGSAAQVRIPTGQAISSRLVEALDQVIVVKKDSMSTIEINVEHAESNFKFIAGLLSQDQAIDWGEILMDVTFTYQGHSWKECIHYVYEDERLDGSSLTKPLEIVWDKAAIRLAISIVKNVNTIESKFAGDAVDESLGKQEVLKTDMAIKGNCSSK